MFPVVAAPNSERAPLGPSPAEVHEQLRRLLASRHLRESHQLSALLEFVVRETLEGRADGLKEYLLGASVFGRRHDYDPRHDGIVRVQATSLRKRLEKYYLDEGVRDPVVIDIPRGAYVPHFRYAEVQEAVPLPAPSAPAVQPAARRPLRNYAIAFCLGMLVAGTAAWMLWKPQPAVRTPYTVTAAKPSDFPQLWAAFFNPDVRGVLPENLVAYGVPLFYNAASIYFRDTDVNVPSEAGEHRIRQFSRAFNITPLPADDIYTGVGELESTHLVSNFFSSGGVPTRVANARTLGRSDLTGHNLIVLSSLRFQTLLHDLHLPRDFEFIPVRPEIVHNLKPRAGEISEYIFQNGEGVSTSYAVISVWPGVTPGRRIVHVGGVHTWSTQAATEFLLQPEQLKKMAQAFEADRKTGARGPVSPYFQILLRVEGRGNQSRKVEYVTHHYLPANTQIAADTGS